MSIALVGGDEFRADCVEMDRALLGRCSGRSKKVLVLPTAAANQQPELAASNGVAYFKRLQVEAESLMVLDRRSADDKRLAQQVEDAALVYLAGGDPSHLFETLQGSLVWQAVLEAHQDGAWLAGSSAGAMVLAETMRDREGKWRQTFGLAERVAVLPHHERVDQQQAIRARSSLEDSVTLLGIDGATACISEEEGVWDVIGVGSVTLYYPGGMAIYSAGESFVL